MAKAKELGFKNCIVPKENEEEGAVVSGINVYGVDSLNEAASIINEGFKRKPLHKDIGDIYEAGALSEKPLILRKYMETRE